MTLQEQIEDKLWSLRDELEDEGLCEAAREVEEIHRLSMESAGRSDLAMWQNEANRLNGLLRVANTERNDGERLAASFKIELDRLAAGKFTKDEIHNICHNLHGTVDACEFAKGCEEEQRKLYGRAPDADFRQECLNALGEHEDSQIDIARRISQIRDEGRDHFHNLTKLQDKVKETKDKAAAMDWLEANANVILCPKYRGHEGWAVNPNYNYNDQCALYPTLERAAQAAMSQRVAKS